MTSLVWDRESGRYITIEEAERRTKAQQAALDVEQSAAKADLRAAGLACERLQQELDQLRQALSDLRRRKV